MAEQSKNPPAQAPDDDSDDEQADVQYNLGFVDEPESHLDLLRHRFPSKVGGLPAWLDPLNLPPQEKLACGATGRPLQFLLQIYAPVDVNPDDAFHRSLFLFISPDGRMLSQPGAVRALRCQLPRRNPYYAFQPAGRNDKKPRALKAEDPAISLAKDPWKVVQAEQACSADAPPPPPAGGPRVFPELELLVEPEEDEESMAADEKLVQQALEAYHARVAEEGEFDEEELPAEVLSQVEENLGPERRHFAAFQARIGGAPDQVLRYSFQEGAAPLWPCIQNIPTPADIPNCPSCGSQRRFEFQVLPQLLSSLELDEEDPECPDWATIAVYTCSRSCNIPSPSSPQSSPQPQAEGEGEGQAQQQQQGAGSAGPSNYVEEFVWVQTYPAE